MSLRINIVLFATVDVLIGQIPCGTKGCLKSITSVSRYLRFLSNRSCPYQDPVPRLRAGDVAEAPAPLVGGAALGAAGIRRRVVILRLRGGHHTEVRVS